MSTDTITYFKQVAKLFLYEKPINDENSITDFIFKFNPENIKKDVWIRNCVEWLPVNFPITETFIHGFPYLFFEFSNLYTYDKAYHIFNKLVGNNNKKRSLYKTRKLFWETLMGMRPITSFPWDYITTNARFRDIVKYHSYPWDWKMVSTRFIEEYQKIGEIDKIDFLIEFHDKIDWHIISLKIKEELFKELMVDGEICYWDFDYDIIEKRFGGKDDNDDVETDSDDDTGNHKKMLLMKNRLFLNKNFTEEKIIESILNNLKK